VERVSVVGAGSFGTALALQLARVGNEVKICAYEEKVRDEINKLHQNLTFLPDIKLSKKITATNDLDEVYKFSEFIFLAPPLFALGNTLPKKGSGKVFVCASKGIEKDTHKLANQIVEDEVEGKYEVVVLSGPSFAKEIGEGKDTKVVIASRNNQILKKIEQLIKSNEFKVAKSSDVVGVELGGALKNVLAILSGMVEGARLGKNFRAAVFTEGLGEVIKLGEKMGAKRETFYTVAGLGDLFLTSTSDLSRNFSFGYRLGSGDKVKKALKTKAAIEGVGTTESAYHLSQKYELEAPLFKNVYATIFEGKDPKKALDDIWDLVT
jgi:glycerol-3-phosphate dehydrogenase (NAD(P)+)